MTTTGTADAIFRPLVIGVLVWCIALATILVVDQFAQGGWYLSYLPVFCAATAVEAYISYGIWKRVGPYSSWTRFRLPEFAGLFVALQLCVDVANGAAPIAGNIPRFDGSTLILAIPVAVAWLVGTDAAGDLNRLNQPPENDPLHATTFRRLSVRFLWGGLVLFCATGVTQSGMAHRAGFPDTTVAAPVLNVLVYFLAGMLMLGQVRYATLAQRWRARDIAVAAGLRGRWVQYSLAFLGLVLLVAFLLPTSRTVGLINVGQAVWNALFDLFWGPLTRLLSHFSSTAPRTPPRVIPPLPPHPPPRTHPHGAPHHGGGGPSWGHLLQALLFWAVVAAGAIYMIRAAVSSRIPGTARAAGRLAAVMRALGRVWHAIARRLQGWGGALTERIPDRLAVLPAAGPALGGILPFKRRGPLSAREQVLRYYLNVVQQAQRRGVRRSPSATPREFSNLLVPRLPEGGEDMRNLTEAFVDARYSLHPVGEGEAEQVHGLWQHVRAALRHLR